MINLISCKFQQKEQKTSVVLFPNIKDQLCQRNHFVGNEDFINTKKSNSIKNMLLWQKREILNLGSVNPDVCILAHFLRRFISLEASTRF